MHNLKKRSDKSPVSDTFDPQRLPRPLRYRSALLRLRYILLSVGVMLVLVVAGLTIFINQSVAHDKSTLVATRTLIPTPIHTPAPTSTPIPIPTSTPVPTPTSIPTPMPVPALIPTATPRPVPPTMQTYEAELSSNTLIGNTSVISVASCSACSGGEKVWYIGNGNALQFNLVNVTVSGNYILTLYYCTNEDRVGYVSVDNNPGIAVSFASTGSFNIVGSHAILVTLNAGDNTIKFYNDNGFAPDLDKIVISA